MANDRACDHYAPPNRNGLEKIQGGEKPHFCAHCNRSVSVARTRKANLPIHTGEKLHREKEKDQY